MLGVPLFFSGSQSRNEVRKLEMKKYSIILVVGRMLVVVALLVVGFTASPVVAGYSFGPSASGFTYLGDPPTKWEPGPNTARFHSPPFGPPGTPGGATFSIMGAGFVNVTGWPQSGPPTHPPNSSTDAITALNVSEYEADDYEADINAALDVWASVSMFTNLGWVADGGVDVGASEASGGHLGDIRVAAWDFRDSTALAHAYQPGTEAEYGPGGTIAGDLHIDVGRNWVNNPFDMPGNGQFDFFTIALHELGHSLGLGHSTVVDSVMVPVYAGARRALYPDDIAGIQAIYGVPEPATMALLAIGGLAMLVRRWRRRA